MESVTLQSKEGENFVVTSETANLFGTVKNLLMDGATGVIPLPEVNSRNLKQILNFTQSQNKDEFLSSFDRSTLLELINSTNYMDYKELLDLTMKEIVKNIKGKTPQEIREYFGIQSDFTPEEEEQVRKENEWIGEQ